MECFLFNFKCEGNVAGNHYVFSLWCLIGPQVFLWLFFFCTHCVRRTYILASCLWRSNFIFLFFFTFTVIWNQWGKKQTNQKERNHSLEKESRFFLCVTHSVIVMMSIYISSSALVLLHNHSSVTMVGCTRRAQLRQSKRPGLRWQV